MNAFIRNMVFSIWARVRVKASTASLVTLMLIGDKNLKVNELFHRDSCLRKCYVS